MSHLIAAIDESMRANNYLLCATVASTADRPHLRRSLRGLLLPNQRRLHANHESDGRNRMLLKSLAELGGFSCHVVVGHQRRRGGREECLRMLVTQVLELGVREVLIERVDHGTTRLDQQVMDEFSRQCGQRFEWRHEAPEHEPLLWISDLVLLAYGAGGQWRRAAECLITTVSVLHK